MDASPPTSPEVSEAIEAAAAPPSTEDNGAREIIINNLVRESADGGSTQSLKSDSQDGGYSDGDGGDKERENLTLDLDKDVDDMTDMAYSQGDGAQVNPGGSDSLAHVSVDFTHELRGEQDGSIRSNDEEAAAEMYAVIDDMKLHSVTDVNGNHQHMEAVSEKSFTSDTSSAFAENVVKNALDKAVEVVKSQEGVEAEMQQATEADTHTATTGPTRVDNVLSNSGVGDVKVGLFQYGPLSGDESEESDNDDGDEDDNDVIPVEKGQENSTEKEIDVKVGMFQYFDSSELERVRSPEVSEMEDDEDETGDDRMESMTDEEKQNILKLYGLDGVEAISPKSASPTDSVGNTMEVDNSKEMPTDDVAVVDVQRQVYEQQTRQFSVNRDPSSSESTPRLEDSIKIDTKDFEDQNQPEETKATEEMDVTDNDIKQDTDNVAVDNNGLMDEFDTPSDKAEGLSEQNNEKTVTEQNTSQTITDDRIMCKNETGTLQDVSPPLMQYEPVKENGKFRIVKTPKEGGGASYATIRVGGDIEPSPRESRSEGGSSDQGSSSTRGSPAELSPRNTGNVQINKPQNDSTHKDKI